MVVVLIPAVYLHIIAQFDDKRCEVKDYKMPRRKTTRRRRRFDTKGAKSVPWFHDIFTFFSFIRKKIP